MRRLLTTLMIAIALTCAGTSATAATQFRDVPPTHVFVDEIAWLADSGISTGYPDGTFHPSAPVLREQMAAFLYRLAGEPAVTSLPPTSTFADVSTSHAFYRAIVWLADTGITTGYDDGTFRPSQPVLREQMAAFLQRFRAMSATPQPGTGSFADVPSSMVFAPQIRWLNATGITTGYPDGTFRPSQPVLREQMAAFLYRYDTQFGDGDGAPAGPFTSTPTPTVVGTAQVGTRLRGVPGVWTPQPTAVTFQWLRNGTAIPGATSLGYTPTTSDTGATLSFRATATRPGAASSTRTSAATAVVAAAPTAAQRILDDTNAFRAQQGKPPLSLMPQINTVAQSWAQHLHDTCTFVHNPNYAAQIPPGWQAAAENIAAGQQYTTVVQAWINSPGHRVNLLGDYTHIGIGYVNGTNCNGRYFVQVFARY